MGGKNECNYKMARRVVQRSRAHRDLHSGIDTIENTRKIITRSEIGWMWLSQNKKSSTDYNIWGSTFQPSIVIINFWPVVRCYQMKRIGVDDVIRPSVWKPKVEKCMNAICLILKIKSNTKIWVKYLEESIIRRGW